jgi:hypothetical protein
LLFTVMALTAIAFVAGFFIDVKWNDRAAYTCTLESEQPAGASSRCVRRGSCESPPPLRSCGHATTRRRSLAMAGTRGCRRPASTQVFRCRRAFRRRISRMRCVSAGRRPRQMEVRDRHDPRGLYLRVRLRGKPPGIYEQIAPRMAELEAPADRDEDRPLIEFYRRRDEIDLLVPARV